MVRGIDAVWLPVEDMDRADSEAPGPEGGAVLAFQPVYDLDSTVDELRDKGVEVPGGISEHPWGRIAPLHDPDGNSLQLYEPPKS
jgi:predicted enzyme related to lactoylglutathione lyase